MRCWQCGTQVSSDEPLCPECFAELDPDRPAGNDGEQVRCPGCGTHCDADATTCPACGYPLEDAGLPAGEDDE